MFDVQRMRGDLRGTLATVRLKHFNTGNGDQLQHGHDPTNVNLPNPTLRLDCSSQEGLWSAAENPGAQGVQGPAWVP